jgi:hypothetical protein
LDTALILSLCFSSASYTSTNSDEGGTICHLSILSKGTCARSFSQLHTFQVYMNLEWKHELERISDLVSHLAHRYVQRRLFSCTNKRTHKDVKIV